MPDNNRERERLIYLQEENDYAGRLVNIGYPIDRLAIVKKGLSQKDSPKIKIAE